MGQGDFKEYFDFSIDITVIYIGIDPSLCAISIVALFHPSSICENSASLQI